MPNDPEEIFPDDIEFVEETTAPETIPAPAEPAESLSADHGFPSPRRCQPEE